MIQINLIKKQKWTYRKQMVTKGERGEEINLEFGINR